MITYDAETNLGTIDIEQPGNQHNILVRQEIQFQNGPVGENGVNGVQNEDVLRLVVTRLQALNAAFPCRENSLAITKIEEAIHWLDHRTALRREQGVEGKREAHVS